ncbi:hypothetical protein BK648_07700 [Pseudomonas poae]|uniref:Uncharacterized protein n=1 Tax=Pseudomonas poae TaxID=200451 RepID=A0A423FAT4_9PSED|nr:hypothetical protein [Pseudomonas poae]ROM53420.1 hypothetical protein BK648_07700 [Pseudomonas poae]
MSTALIDIHQVRRRLTTIIDNVERYISRSLRPLPSQQQALTPAIIEAAATSVTSLLTGTVYQWLLSRTEINLLQLPQMLERVIRGLLISIDVGPTAQRPA